MSLADFFFLDRDGALIPSVVEDDLFLLLEFVAPAAAAPPAPADAVALPAVAGALPAPLTLPAPPALAALPAPPAPPEIPAPDPGVEDGDTFGIKAEGVIIAFAFGPGALKLAGLLGEGVGRFGLFFEFLRSLFWAGKLGLLWLLVGFCGKFWL